MQLPHGLDPKAARWISVLAGPILALLAFVLAYWLDPLHFKSENPTAAVPAFLLSTVILMVSQAIVTIQETQKTSTHSDRIYEAIKEYLHVIRVGSPEEAFRYVAGRLSILREVKNTSFNLENKLERPNEKFYATQTYIRTMQDISQHCCHELLWKDVGDSLAVARFRSVRVNAERLSHGKPHGYKFKVLPHIDPQINFMVLEYTDGITEALFNWDFRGTGQDPIVLLSRDKYIVDMFSIQFAMLWDRGSEDHDTQPTRSVSVK